MTIGGVGCRVGIGGRNDDAPSGILGKRIEIADIELAGEGCGIVCNVGSLPGDGSVGGIGPILLVEDVVRLDIWRLNGVGAGGEKENARVYPGCFSFVS